MKIVKGILCRVFVLSAVAVYGAVRLCLAAPAPDASQTPMQTVQGVAPAQPLTLEQAYQLALVRSETLGMDEQEIGKAQSRFYRAWDNFLPTVSFLMTRKEQDSAESSSSEGVSGDFRRRVTPENKFVFSQPIFSGFKEFAAIQASGADRREQQYRLQRAKELLFLDVMEAFYAYLQIQRDIEILDAIHSSISERMRELDERIRIGRSRESEMQSTRVDLKLNESDQVQARGLWTVARNLLEFYIGQSLTGLIPADPDIAMDSPDVFQKPLGAAAQRSDVQATEQALIVAQSKVISAQADLFPTVKLDGNYYTRRVGFQSGNDWDVLLSIEVPVFEVGRTLGDIKEASAGKKAAQLAFWHAKRSAALEAENATEDLRSAWASEKALAEANEASKENYRLLAEDYRTNLVGNLEVLDALRRSQEIRRRANQAHYQTRKNFWRFKIALGMSPMQPAGGPGRKEAKARP